MRPGSVSLWIALAMVAGQAISQVITTVAGTTFTFPSQPLPALSAPLGFPQGVAADAKGNVYVADTFNNLVLRIAPDGTLTIAAGNGTSLSSGDGGLATNAGVAGPAGVAVDSSGNLYIAEAFRIRMVSGGIITTVAGNGTQGFSGDGGPATKASLNNPSSLAVDNSGTVYIVDRLNNRVRKVSGGIITTVAGDSNPRFSGDGGPAASAGLNNPNGIAVDSNGALYIADLLNYRIRKVSAGIITTVAGNGTAGFSGDGGPAAAASLYLPASVGVDSAGNLYIADLRRIRKVTTDGAISTVAGTGEDSYTGDGGPALSAGIVPTSLSVDSTANLYFSDHAKIRKVSAGIINTIAGNGAFKFSGDGGPATSATLNGPAAVAVDTAGSLYIADRQNNRIRKVSGGVMSTIAGNGGFGFGLDGPATGSVLGAPGGIAADASGNVYIADTAGSRIRKISGGTITTIAGTGIQGSTGDGGPALNAQLINPAAMVLDATGSIYFVEQSTSKIRKISNGIITTVAGNGTSGFSGDGGPAVAAQLNDPTGIAIDSAGNLYISDFVNTRIRKVSNGTITTIAGNGSFGYSGEGGPAGSASLDGPEGIAADAQGNLYVVDGLHVRKISNGIISTIAGTAVPGFAGDGGPAKNATFNGLSGIAVDARGDLFLADTQNDRIREILSAPASFQVSPNVLSFAGVAGAALPSQQTVRLSPSVPGLAFAAASSAPWLDAGPTSGTMPTTLLVTADPSQLEPGVYSGTIFVNAPDATPSSQTIQVSFTVSAAPQGKIAVSAASLSFSFDQGASPGSQQVTLSNQGAGAIRYSASAAFTNSGNLVAISPANGSITASNPVSVTVTAAPGAIGAGTYSGAVTISSPDTGQQIPIPIAVSVSAPAQKILLSQTGFSFTAVAGGGAPPLQTLGVLNTGSGTLNYNVKTITSPGSPSWLKVSANSGTVVRPFLDVSFVDVSVDAGSLAAGTYYGQVQVSSSGASNSPQTAVVVLTVLPAGSNPGPVVSPNGLVFTGAAGGGNPGSQNVSVTNLTATPLVSGSSITYVGAKGWINYLPTDFTVQPNVPAKIVVQPDFSSLATGVYRAYLTLGFADGSSSIVNILAVVAPSGTPQAATALEVRDASTAGCAATKLIPQFTQVGFGSVATVGYPQLVQVTVVDDCGVPQTDGSVVVSFSNGDPPISLVSLQDGTWTYSWQPGRLASTVTLTAAAQFQSLTGAAAPYTLALQQAAQNPPVLSGAPLGVGTLAPDKFAPGDLILVRGTNIADGAASSPSAGFQQPLAGASLLVGGKNASLLYVDAGQAIGVVPFGLPVNTQQQVVVQRDNALGTPVPVNIAATHPVILTKDGSGQGQALIYKSGTLADAAHPANPGDTLVIYCSGLGPVDANGVATNTPTVMLGGVPSVVGYAGTARTGDYPSGGAPTLLGVVSAALGGLYQINVTVPGGLAGGPVAVTVASADQISPPGVTLVAAGGGSANAPSITGINTAYGTSDISQNDFIEIHGTNLAAATAGPAALTTQLGGVSVDVDGKSALLYYVSPAQINALTPLDNTTGPVSVVVKNGSLSAQYMANLRAVTPAFLRLGDNAHITATHADGSLIGPAALGSLFTPAAPGETIVIYSVGFGLPSSALTSGSPAQSGPLPTLPVCQVSGLPAAVAFAGLNGFAGLYQINLMVPSGAPTGDNAISCTYAGAATPAGALLAVGH